VVLELHIRQDGSVGDARTLRSAPIFGRYALNAALGWKYNPVLANGKQLDALMPATVTFTPPTAAPDGR
jgi:TonB family protein